MTRTAIYQQMYVGNVVEGAAAIENDVPALGPPPPPAARSIETIFARSGEGVGLRDQAGHARPAKWPVRAEF